MRTLQALACALLCACAAGESGSGNPDPTPDAPVVQTICGDGTCASSEVGVCSQDCGGGTPAVCGNAVCEGSETNATCPADCPPAGPVCGDGVCDSAGGETSDNCPGDCVVVNPAIDCADPTVLISCASCVALGDPMLCGLLGVSLDDCATCVGL